MSDNVREAFERDMLTAGHCIATDGGGNYTRDTLNKFLGYQAASAAADAEWRGVVEKLVGAVSRAVEINYAKQTDAAAKQWAILTQKDLAEALAQAEQLMGGNNDV